MKAYSHDETKLKEIRAKWLNYKGAYDAIQAVYDAADDINRHNPPAIRKARQMEREKKARGEKEEEERAQAQALAHKKKEVEKKQEVKRKAQEKAKENRKKAEATKKAAKTVQETRTTPPRSLSLSSFLRCPLLILHSILITLYSVLIALHCSITLASSLIIHSSVSGRKLVIFQSPPRRPKAGHKKSKSGSMQTLNSSMISFWTASVSKTKQIGLRNQLLFK